MEAQLALRFWSKVRTLGEHDCWVWGGGYRSRIIDGVSHRDYGMYRGQQAHRVAYMRVFGDITTGHVVDHTCENKKCCNPNHLEAVSNGENVRRAVARKKEMQAS